MVFTLSKPLKGTAPVTPENSYQVNLLGRILYEAGWRIHTESDQTLCVGQSMEVKFVMSRPQDDQFQIDYMYLTPIKGNTENE